MSLPLCAERAPLPVRYPDDTLLTITGLIIACPSTLLRVLDAVVVLGGVPTEIRVRRGRASFRLHLLVAIHVGGERMRDRLAGIVGVRCVSVARGFHCSRFVESAKP